MGKLLSFCFVDRQTKHHKELIRLENVEENPSYDKSLWDHLDLCLLSSQSKYTKLNDFKILQQFLTFN